LDSPAGAWGWLLTTPPIRLHGVVLS